MIRVERPATTFPILVINGVLATQQHNADYAAGKRDFSFDARIYGHDAVKKLLVDMHHGKCCYCESKVRSTGPGTIDHYRPKAASQQRQGDPLIRPGYYWLAYNWENLLFSCIACNQTHKRNLFPLRSDAQRALSHLDPIDQEEPLLVDPSSENPEDFISFREEYAIAVDEVRGRITIDVFKLNERPDLVDNRRERIKYLRLFKKIIKRLPHSQVAADAQQCLDEAVMDTGEYAALCRAFCQSNECA